MFYDKFYGLNVFQGGLFTILIHYEENVTINYSLLNLDHDVVDQID